MENVNRKNNQHKVIHSYILEAQLDKKNTHTFHIHKGHILTSFDKTAPIRKDVERNFVIT